MAEEDRSSVAMSGLGTGPSARAVESSAEHARQTLSAFHFIGGLHFSRAGRFVASITAGENGNYFILSSQEVSCGAGNVTRQSRKDPATRQRPKKPATLPVPKIEK